MADVEYWNPQKAISDIISGVHIKSITIDRGLGNSPSRFLVSTIRFSRTDNEYLAKYKHGVWKLSIKNKHGSVFTKDDVSFLRATIRLNPTIVVSDIIDATTVKRLMRDGVKIKIKR